METLEKEKPKHLISIDLSSATIGQIAEEIQRYIIAERKQEVSIHAKPYISAMLHLRTVDDTYGDDNGRSIISYFLSNAQYLRGPAIKAIKDELKERLKQK